MDTPGHEDFSEDTYRTLTAVDSALMVIDGAKGVEERTIKLMEVCRMRDTPIISFVNKMDREIREPLELLDEIESVLNIRCVPITWPLGMGRDFAGVYNLLEDKLYVYKAGFGSTITDIEIRDGYDHADIREKVGELAWASFEESLELVQMANEPLDRELFLQGKQTPVLFGTALGNFGVDHVLMPLFSGHQNQNTLPKSVPSRRLKKDSVALYLRFRPIWIRNIVTGLPLCEFVRVNMKRPENESCALG